MKISFFSAFLGLLILMNSSCAGDEAAQNSKEKSLHFFDIAGYFEGEIERLQAAQPKVSKLLTLNEQTETLELNDIDFSEELSIFEKTDINKVSWIEKYEVDTIKTAGDTRQVIYTATDDKLKTRKIEISFVQGQLTQIKILNKVDSPILKSEQRMLYIPDSGYEIEQVQKVRFLSQKLMKVVVRFVRG